MKKIMEIQKKVSSAVIAVALLLTVGSVVAQDGVNNRSIVLGQSIALTGPGSGLAVPFYTGAKIYFDRVNTAGGINGRKIELVTLDDTGRPTNTAANTKKLLDQGVLSLFGFYGSLQVGAAYPLIKNTDIILFAPMSAADEFRGPLYVNIYSIRPGYSAEAAAITRHALTLGSTKFGVLHATDGESLSALEAAERTMIRLGAELVVKTSMGGGNLATSVDIALDAQPQSILLISDAPSAASVVRDLKAKGFRGLIYGFSNTGESLLADELGPEGAGVVVVRVVPVSDHAKVQVVRELAVDALAAKAGKPNVYMLEGYIAARTYAEALRRIQQVPNRALLKRSLESLNNFVIGDFRVHFATNRVGSNLVELSVVDSQGRVRH